MKCLDCGGQMSVSHGPHKYKESGLDNVTLKSIEHRACQKCGEREVVIPDLPGLHGSLATTLALKKGLLTPKEFRFLRKYLGHSQADFARIVGVAQPTLNRWERGRAEISRAYEIILRQMVCLSKRVTSYQPELVSEVASAAANSRKALPVEMVPTKLKQGHSRTQWMSPESSAGRAD